MGLFEKIRQVFTGKKSAGPITRANYIGPYRYFFLPDGEDLISAQYYDFREFVRHGYTNPHVYAVVSKIARSYAGLPRDYFRGKQGEERIETPRGNLLEAVKLLDGPSWKYGTAEFLEAVAQQYLITGNAIIIGLRPVGMRRYGELMIAQTKDVTVYTDNGAYSGRPVQYDVTEYGSFPAEDVLHIRMPNSIEETYWGLSPLYAAQSIYKASNNTLQASASIHKNRGATGVLSPKGADQALMPQDQKALQEGWDERSSGTRKFGKVHVSMQEMTFTQIGMNATDLKLIEHDIEHLRAICRIYGVDSKPFGDPGASTYNNIVEANESFFRDVLDPLSQKLDTEISAWLIGQHFSTPDVYYRLDRGKVPFLNKPDTELTGKLISEVNAGILPPQNALEMLYPDVAEKVEAQRRAQQDAAATAGNPQADSERAKAQANLLGSVGGVTGILSLQASVAQGVTQYDAGIAILMLIYGLDLESARQILGRPEAIQAPPPQQTNDDPTNE